MQLKARFGAALRLLPLQQLLRLKLAAAHKKDILRFILMLMQQLAGEETTVAEKKGSR